MYKIDSKVRVSAKVNSEHVQFLCESRQSLLEVLRDTLQLTGTKEGCNDGNCGACSVLVNGELINSCCMFAVEAEECEIETVEGLALHGKLHPLQVAFIEENALQCGMCTPGILMSSKALLERKPNPTETDIREWLAGNLCRCTGYDRIVVAVMNASEKLQGSRRE